MTKVSDDAKIGSLPSTELPRASTAGSLVADLPSYCTSPPIETVIFGWGVTEDGQLALGQESRQDIERPSVIESLLGTSFSGFRFNRRPLVAGSRHTLAITEAGKVLSWGWNDRGTLGLGHRHQTLKPTVIEALEHEHVVQLAAGGWHCVAITNEGKMYAWGGNEYFQCGVGAEQRDICVPKQTVPFLTVSMVSCGGMHSVALTDGGDVWQWGEPWGDFSITVNRSPRKLDVSNIVSIASGAFHNLALNSSNEVLAWGTNDYGQLGTGDTAYTPQPRHTVGLSAVCVADIAAQGWHSLALTADGEVYTWGRGEYGRLGLNDIKGASHVRPMKVPGLEGHTVIQASCGGTHTMVLTDRGHMFIWGRCLGGRLGFPAQSTVEFPHELALPGGAERWHPICIAAGGRHSMCMALPRHTVTDHERRQSALSGMFSIPHQPIAVKPRPQSSPQAHSAPLSRSVGDVPSISMSVRESTYRVPPTKPPFLRRTDSTDAMGRRTTTSASTSSGHGNLGRPAQPATVTLRGWSAQPDELSELETPGAEEPAWPPASEALAGTEGNEAAYQQIGFAPHGQADSGSTSDEATAEADVPTPRLGDSSSAQASSPTPEARAIESPTRHRRSASQVSSRSGAATITVAPSADVPLGQAGAGLGSQGLGDNVDSPMVGLQQGGGAERRPSLDSPLLGVQRAGSASLNQVVFDAADNHSIVRRLSTDSEAEADVPERRHSQAHHRRAHT